MKNILLLIFIIILIVYYQGEEETEGESNIEDLTLSRIIIEVDGKKRDFYSFHGDIEKIIAEEQINLNDNDYFYVEFKEGLCYIKIIKGYNKVKKEIIEIPYPIEIKESRKFQAGFTTVLQKGRPGFKEIEYKIIYQGDKELKREVLAETAIIPPKPEIILKG